MPAGYSQRSLVEKLGIKAGMRIAILNAPRGYRTTLGKLPSGVTVASTARGALPFIQFFTVDRALFERQLPALLRALADNAQSARFRFGFKVTRLPQPPKQGNSRGGFDDAVEPEPKQRNTAGQPCGDQGHGRLSEVPTAGEVFEADRPSQEGFPLR